MPWSCWSVEGEPDTPPLVDPDAPVPVEPDTPPLVLAPAEPEAPPLVPVEPEVPPPDTDCGGTLPVPARGEPMPLPPVPPGEAAGLLARACASLLHASKSAWLGSPPEPRPRWPANSPRR